MPSKNKPGANGLLAIDELVKSPPDGYTVMIGNVTTNAIAPILYKSKMPSRLRQDGHRRDQLPHRCAGLRRARRKSNFPVKTIA